VNPSPTAPRADSGPDPGLLPPSSSGLTPQFLASLVELAPVPIYAVTAADGRFLSVNPAAEAEMGLPRTAILGRTLDELLTPDFVARARAVMDRVVAGRAPVRVDEHIDRPDGRRFFRTVKFPLFAPDGTVAAVGGMSIDVTAERRVQAALRESEDRSRRLFDALPVPCWVYDRRTLAFLAANEAAAAALGYPRERLAAMTIRDIRPPEDVPRLEETVRRAGAGPMRSGRWRHRRADGSIIQSEVTSHGVEYEGRPARIAVAVDVTARVHAETELAEARRKAAESDKMRALGQMAAGVAHDFNNALTGILGFAEVLSLREDLPGPAAGMSDSIRQIALGAAGTVRRMQAFARSGAAVRPAGVTDLARAVREAAELTRPPWHDVARRRGAEIDLVVEAPVGTEESASASAAAEPAVVPAAVNPDEVADVLTNLIFNAADAIPRKGTVRLRAGFEGPTPDRPNGCVFVSVSDDGVGMAEETRRRCFEPFFTTKGPAGTGLGLAVCWAVAHRRGGEISVDSAPGRGSTFTLRLPPARPASAPAASDAAPAGPDDPHARSLEVLLVEDQDVVRRTLAEMLRSLGCRVQTARDGPGGLELIRLSCSPRAPEGPADGRVRAGFDLLVTDLSMPGMGGHTLAAEARRLVPALPVLTLTGWGPDSCVDETLRLEDYPDHPDSDAPSETLGKPVTMEALRAAVERLIGRTLRRDG
jgi:PAS domain S-box-containing protein